MVATAWTLTIIFSSPQAVIFRLLKHPAKEFYQCTTINFFENLSDLVKEGNSTELRLYGLTPDQWEDTYHTVFNSQIFFIPLVIIVASYVKILLILTRRSNASSKGAPQTAELEQVLQRPTHSTAAKRAEPIVKKSAMKALKMSCIHVLAFVFSWTPYTVMATWDTIDSVSARQVPGLVQDILYLTAVLNTCINPLIYGVYYYSERASQASRAVSSRNNLASFRSQSNISHLSITPQTTKSALKGRRETLTTSRPDPKSAHYMSRKFSASPRCQMKISDEEFELVKVN